MKSPAVATVMPNTSSNQLITAAVNHNAIASHQSIQSNLYDDYSSQYGQSQGNFSNQQLSNYNHNYNPYWKDGPDFYRSNSEYYQSNRNSETKSQYPYPQDPRLEVGEIRMVKSEPSYQNYEENSYSGGSNDHNLYQNRGFNQDINQGSRQAEQPLSNQGFSSDVQKVTQSHFSNQGTNQDIVPCQNIPKLLSESTAEQIPMSKPKSKSTRNRKPALNNKHIQKNQSVAMSNSGVHVDNNCNDNESNLKNQQIMSCSKDISFSRAFGQSNTQEIHTNSNQRFPSNQDILTSTNKEIFGGSSVRNNEDMQFNSHTSSLSESNKGIYGGNLMKQVNDNCSTDVAVSFEGMFDNRVMLNQQKSNMNHQHASNSIQTNINPQVVNNRINNNQGTLNNHNIPNQMIDNPGIINSVNQGILCNSNNQRQSTNSLGTLQLSHSRPISHDRNMLTVHQEIEQKFVNQQQHLQQQQESQHQQQSQQQQYQNSDSTLSSCGQIPIREPFINSNNSYGNYNLMESNQHISNHSHNYETMLRDSSFQNQNILTDQMLHDQEMLLANDQAMLSALNSTNDVNEQALLYNAMVGQPDGHSLLGLLEPPSMMSNQMNEYQPVYGPLPSHIKPGLPGGAKTNPESNQYSKAPNIQQIPGRVVNLMPEVHNQNDIKMYSEPNRYSISNSNESYPRYSNYSPMYPPFTPSTNTPLGSISDILDNIPRPERSYQNLERKNPASCTVTSQDINPLPPFCSLDNKTKYEYGGCNSNADNGQSHDEKSSMFSADKESLEDTIDPKISTLEEGEIKNPSLLIKSGKEEPGIPYDWVSYNTLIA